tara:strand:- start:248 stop:826 length:579 start_codon:yes stop_codon:yes gene_type:complete
MKGTIGIISSGNSTIHIFSIWIRDSIKLIFIVLVLITPFFIQCSKPKNQETTSDSVFVDKVKLSNLKGKQYNLSKHKDKTVILSIWATWCKPCIEEMPSLEALQNKLSLDKYSILLASDESLDKINRFKNSNNYDLNFVKLETPATSLGIYALPTTFIINEKGELLLTENGSKKWDSEESIQAIMNLEQLKQ